MFIHIGDRKTISDRKCIGIFNAETMKMSGENSWMSGSLHDAVRTVAVDDANNILTSSVSPYTVIKRTSLDDDIVWRKKYE